MKSNYKGCVQDPQFMSWLSTRAIRDENGILVNISEGAHYGHVHIMVNKKDIKFIKDRLLRKQYLNEKINSRPIQESENGRLYGLNLEQAILGRIKPGFWYSRANICELLPSEPAAAISRALTRIMRFNLLTRKGFRAGTVYSLP